MVDSHFIGSAKSLGLFQLCLLIDDLLLFCKADEPSVRVFWRGLHLFASLSRLHANPQKSQVILSKAAQPVRDALLTWFGFSVRAPPGWEGNRLSFAGRVQLIKSVLMALEVYWAMAFISPKGVIKEMEKRFCSFLWKGTTSSGYPKVAWDQVCKLLAEGGKGIKDILALNRVLMSRHLWALIAGERNSIWVDWIVHTRLRDKSIWTVTDDTGSWAWKKLLRLRPILLSNIQYRMGDGKRLLLWHDQWHTLGPLILRYPRGPQLTGTSSSHTLHIVLANGQWRWPPITDIAHLQIIHLLPPIQPWPDRVTWRSNGGTFSSSSTYDLFRPPGPKVGWSSLLFGSLKIPRNCFILWLAILRKLSTFDKPWLLHLGGTYVLCVDGQTKTHDHLFFTCSYSRQCLARIREHVRFQWPHTSWDRGIAWASARWRGKHVVNAAYRALLASLVYHIWQECNRRRFQSTSRPPWIVGSIVIDEVTQRILSASLRFSVSTCGLYRFWRIPWPVEGEEENSGPSLRNGLVLSGSCASSMLLEL
ncbi:UNVERIFIED_CONTAM: hypothetical protein Slati_0877600 [Sesamum latifolium]|uniref:Reverse transcriptase domain-containing protein n=1 Tax=Sesamum latifolium TaxID=2727402 RepID=A0AAW2XQF4_9LAMI